MAYYSTLAKWLADHLGADWLHLSVPRQLPDKTLMITTTIRFGSRYCRISRKYEFELMSRRLEDLKNVRDELFLFNMHEISQEEGSLFEKEVNSSGL